MEVTWTGTIRGAVGPFAAGQTLCAQLAIFLTFRDGQIMRRHDYDCYDPW